MQASVEAVKAPDLSIRAISTEELNQEETLFTYVVQRYDLNTGAIRIDVPSPSPLKIIRKVSFHGDILKVTHRIP